ncbi:hypothetical protein HMPREF3220_02446 [Citrobacter koseri]|nr:hypothetical protein HMPREF3220_02446 [Citrobacter koseri]KWZ99544.1 hypothetical protein HMPREF3207_03881 [Citrobacter koseri]
MNQERKGKDKDSAKKAPDVGCLLEKLRLSATRKLRRSHQQEFW